MNHRRPGISSAASGGWGSARALGLVLAAVLALGACSEPPAVRKQKALERGLAFQAAGKHSEAVIELRSALQIDPDLVPALTALGAAYRGKSFFGDALRELERALRLEPDSAEVRIELGRVFLAVEAWDEAEAQGKALLGKQAASAHGLFLVGAALAGRGQPARGMDLLARAVALAPGAPEIQTAYGEALAGLGRGREAERAYQAALELNPRHADALVGLAGLRLADRNGEAAAEALARARRADPDGTKVRLALSALHKAQGRFPEAIKELEALQPPSWSPRYLLTLGHLYLTAGRFADATSPLRALVARFPDLLVARHLLGHAALGAGRTAEALGEFQEVVKRAPTVAQARLSLALAYMQAGRPEEALGELTVAGKSMARIPEYHVQVGRAALMLGRWDEAMRAAETARRLSPGSPRPWGLLGQVHLARNDLGKAEAMWARALEIDPRFAPAHLALGRILDLRKKPEDAIGEYEAALALDPGNRAAIAAKVAALATAGRLDEARGFLGSRIEGDAGNPHLLTMLGSLHLLRAETRAAEAAYQRALAADEKFVPARFQLARLAATAGRGPEAIAHLERIVTEQPGQVPAAVMLAALHTRDGRFERAISVLEGVVQSAQAEPDVVLRLAEVYLRHGRADQALARLSPLVASRPGLVQARMLLGLAHLEKQAPAEALRHFEQVRKLNPKIALNHYYLGRALLARGDVDGARKAYRQALEIEPGLTQIRLELAGLAGEKPDADLLARHFQALRRAVEADPRNVSARYALARAHIARGDRRAAEAELGRILEAAPLFHPANMTMALFRALERKPEEAAEHLRAVLRASPQHVQANLLLGGHYQQRGQLSLAIQHLDAALKAGPPRDDLKLRLADLNGQVGRVEDALVLAREVVAARPAFAPAHFVLGSLHLNKGNLPQAVEALSVAARLAPDNAVTQLTLASALERAGQMDRALAAYRRARSLMPDDPRPYNNAAWLHAVQGRNLDEALELARKAHELTRRAPALASGLPGVLDTLGFVHFRRGEYAQAEPLLRQAAELAQGQVVVQYHLGLTLEKLGRKDEAVTWLRRSLQGGGRFPEADQARRLLAELGG